MTDWSELRKKAEAATPGPWKCDNDFEAVTYFNGQGTRKVITGYENIIMEESDANYIAAANPSVILQLLDELDAAIEKRNFWRDEFSRLYKKHENCPVREE